MNSPMVMASILRRRMILHNQLLLRPSANSSRRSYFFSTSVNLETIIISSITRLQDKSRLFVNHFTHSIRYISTIDALEQHVQTGKLQPDTAQKRVAKRLTRLQEALFDYDNSILFEKQPEKDSKNEPLEENPTKPNNVAVDRNKDNGETTTGNDSETMKATTSSYDPEVPSQPPVPQLRIPRGLYIHGSVGTGKSMLMDCFYENVELPQSRKQRYHFHNFLSQVHQTIHELKQQDLLEHGRNFTIDTTLQNNPIHRTGYKIASELSLLCLDEFQVTDIADAVILSQLFSVLFQYGTVVVATSNRPPQGLYEGGLNRSYFLPFIDLLAKHCIVYNIPSQKDYRRISTNCSSFFFHDSINLERLINELISKFIYEDNINGDDDGQRFMPRSMQLPVGLQRSIHVDRVYENEAENMNHISMACFRFEELCDTDRGAMDFRAIARTFDIVVVEDIPLMNMDAHNRARRFITLIDELYEAKCALLCTTLEAKTPMDLFHKNDLNSSQKYDNNDDDNEIMWLDVAQQGGVPVGALASVQELVFAFDRASSRIHEMCSRSWWDRVLENRHLSNEYI